MKATLEFQLPEESREHLLASQAAEMSYAMAELKHKLHGWLKHGHEFKTADEAIAAAKKLAYELFDGFDI